MKRLTLFYSFAFILFSLPSVSQNLFKAYVYDSITRQKLFTAAIVVDETTIGGITDTNGTVLLQNIPNGKQEIICSLLGYKKYRATITFPISDTNKPFAISLIRSDDDDDDLETVTVTSSRVNSRIEDIPLKVEVIGEDDVNEETTINPANIP